MFNSIQNWIESVELWFFLPIIQLKMFRKNATILRFFLFLCLKSLSSFSLNLSNVFRAKSFCCEDTIHWSKKVSSSKSSYSIAVTRITTIFWFPYMMSFWDSHRSRLGSSNFSAACKMLTSYFRWSMMFNSSKFFEHSFILE